MNIGLRYTARSLTPTYLLGQRTDFAYASECHSDGEEVIPAAA